MTRLRPNAPQPLHERDPHFVMPSAETAMPSVRPNAPNPTRHPAPATPPASPWIYSFDRPDPEAPILNARAWKTQRDHYRASLEQIHRLPLDRAGDGPAVLLAEMSRLAEEALR